MAKFLVSKSSYFEPFSYDDLMKPIAMQQEVHNAAQETYDKLAMDTAALENYISKNEGDKRARALYDSYRTKLSKLQNNLWDYGIGPQTRMDLSDAKTSYASDITRLAKAIENRQARSKDYWDAVHKDPSLITSRDPGLDGLDNYLDNDRYGQDFYSYSGTQFMTEVGADAKARVNEMLSDPEVLRNDQLKGYLVLKQKEGFSSEEVFKATDAVRKALRGDMSGVENLGYGEGILASVLMNHINSTGAREQLKNGRMDQAMFDRFIDYGSAGLSQSIGKTSYSHLADKVWDDAMQRSRARYVASLNTPNPNVPGRRGYSFDDTPVERRSPMYDKVASQLRNQTASYRNGPVQVVAPDGRVKEYTNPFEATQDIYNTKERAVLKDELHGLDVGLTGGIDKKYRQKVEWTDEKGKKRSYELKFDTDKKRFVVYQDGTDKVDKKASDKFNVGFANYQKHVQQYRDNNPDVDMHLIAISPTKEYEIRQSLGMSNNTPTKYLSDLISDLKYTDTPVTIAGHESGFDYYKDNLKNALLNSYYSAPTDSKGNIIKGSSYGFRKIDGNGNASNNVESDIYKVFGKDLNGKILSVSYFPDDLARNRGNQKVILNVEGSGRWEVPASMLGNNLSSTLDYAASNFISGQAGQYDLLDPIYNKEAVINMGKKDDAYMTSVMHNFFIKNGIQPPVIEGVDKNGNPIRRYASYRETVTNPDARRQFRDAVREYLNDATSVPRDISDINHPQHVGNSSDNASAYIDLGI